jgi:hypothetical protein
LKGREENELKWSVPLTWTRRSEAPTGFDSTQPKEWIYPTDAKKELNIELGGDEWIIFNNQETGVCIMVLTDIIIVSGSKVCYDGKGRDQLEELLLHQAETHYTEEQKRNSVLPLRVKAIFK